MSTGAWIEGDREKTREAIRRWDVLPDYASVNLSEDDGPGVMANAAGDDILDQMVNLLQTQYGAEINQTLAEQATTR